MLGIENVGTSATSFAVHSCVSEYPFEGPQLLSWSEEASHKQDKACSVYY